MTKQLEILDALPGCGKTTAIFKYMAENRDKPYLYLSPMKKEIEERVPEELEKNGLDFFIATEGSQAKTKTLQVLLALQEGKNVACTHALMLRFTEKHLEAIKQHKYQIICDEELDLIKGYNSLTKNDLQFLLEQDIIEISDTDGKISLKKEIPDDTRYTDVANYANMGCLYAAKQRQNFLVIQISPRLMEAADRFILLTYLYEGSVMQTFMQMHGFSDTRFEIPLRFSEQERKKQLLELIDFIETPSVKKVQKMPSALSVSWWKNISVENLTMLERSFMNIVKNNPVGVDNIMHTLPKLNHTGSSDGETTRKVFRPKSFDTDNSYVPSTARATNEFKHKSLAIHMLNIYPNLPVVVYMQDMAFICKPDNHALSTMIQWLFRGCIREGKPMKVAILSKRMSILLKDWLTKN